MTVDAPDPSAASYVEAAVGHVFEDRELLKLALTHRSYASEIDSEASYERLEFLGDAVLQLAVTEYLYRAFPELPEGEMAKTRAAVVDAPTLASVARRLGVGPAMRLGRGEDLTGGRDKDSILADVMEALLGALFVEVGYRAARRLVSGLWAPLVDRRAADPGRRDYKTRLQESLAREGLQPRYVVTHSGPEHARDFAAEVWADDRLLGKGTGTSKKRAEQDAARDAVTGDA